MAFGSLSPEAQGAIVGGATNIIGSLMQAYGQGKISKEQLEQELVKLRVGVHQQDAQNTLSYAQGREQQNRLGFGQVLGALGPHDLAQGRQSMALQRALMFGGPGGAPQQMRGPGVGSAYQANLPNVSGAAPFYSDSAILASEEPFWNAMAGSTRGAIRPGPLQEAGFGAEAAKTAGDRMGAFADMTQAEDESNDLATRERLDADTDKSLAALNLALDQPQKKSGGGFWSKLGKGALAAGAVGAGLFTGGASLTALPAILAMGTAGVSGAFGGGNPALNAALGFGGAYSGALGGGNATGNATPGSAAAAAARSADLKRKYEELARRGSRPVGAA